MGLSNSFFARVAIAAIVLLGGSMLNPSWASGALEGWEPSRVPRLFSKTIHLPHLERDRRLWVFLPEEYLTQPQAQFPVLYMHDGQNLFMNELSFVGEWGIDETLALVAPHQVPPLIVVGIENGRSERYDEYSPWASTQEGAVRVPNGGGRGSLYMQDVVETVVPFIESEFRVNQDRCLAGSSMGGLISIYGIYAHPETFRCALAMSPAIWFSRAAFFEFLEVRRSALSSNHRLYFDVGTQEEPFEKAYVEDAQRMLRMIQQESSNLTQFVLDTGAPHHESAWRVRFSPALEFLYRPWPPPSPQN